jgi:hypothetical protein
MTGRDRHDPLAARGVPAPDEPADDLERARARSFAERIDALIDGRSHPREMASDVCDLLSDAAAIRAAAAAEPPARPDRMMRAVDAALAGFGAAARADEAEGDPRVARRLAWRPALPWIAAAVAAAATAMFALGPKTPSSLGDAAHAAESISTSMTSRPADDLIGAIGPDQAADARSRTDTIFADRLRGYRELAWQPPGGAR